ncbi:MAG: bifunctional adenosylcobinamide kinase/adenosylcobinamide-phosphate guanylyltransferase [Rhodospirillales bacterium]
MSVLPRLTLVLGGARSGKSRYAEQLVAAAAGKPVYIATAEALDDEMRRRVAAHRARRGPQWTTVEAPLALARALGALEPGGPALVDCLTLWLSNAMLAKRNLVLECDGLVAALRSCRAPVVAVSNEVGLGVVPETPLGREFRDAQGVLNQRVAAVADRVVLMAAGLPMIIKD